MTELNLKIAIAEPSIIVRSGLAIALKRIQGIHVQTFEISTHEFLANYIKLHKPDLLVINPTYWGAIDIAKLKEEANYTNLHTIALVIGAVDENFLNQYDEKITLYDSVEQLKQKIHKVFSTETVEHNEEADTLSQREKEILTCVVKGQTNKEIAQTLFLSTHTVITHRRNIARKLGIHSTAGLTIYAIVNKLVELDDIKNIG